jgi:hypothetical protein
MWPNLFMTTNLEWHLMTGRPDIHAIRNLKSSKIYGIYWIAYGSQWVASWDKVVIFYQRYKSTSFSVNLIPLSLFSSFIPLRHRSIDKMENLSSFFGICVRGTARSTWINKHHEMKATSTRIGKDWVLIAKGNFSLWQSSKLLIDFFPFLSFFHNRCW